MRRQMQMAAATPESSARRAAQHSTAPVAGGGSGGAARHETTRAIWPNPDALESLSLSRDAGGLLIAPPPKPPSPSSKLRPLRVECDKSTTHYYEHMCSGAVQCSCCARTFPCRVVSCRVSCRSFDSARRQVRGGLPPPRPPPLHPHTHDWHCRNCPHLRSALQSNETRNVRSLRTGADPRHRSDSQ